MAKVRAYIIAEELGIDRKEFVAKALELGVELKSAMASIDEADADLLRRRLGKQTTVVEETRRVSRKGGAAVIRRRKKAAPTPTPEPVQEAVLEPEVEQEPASTEVVPAEPVVTLETPAEEEVAAPEVSEVEAPESLEPQTPEPKKEVVELSPPPAKKVRMAIVEADPLAEKNKGRSRRRVVVEGNLQEQEKIARQLTGRSFSPRVDSLADVRRIESPRRKRRDALPKSGPAKKAASADRAASKCVVKVDGTISVQDLASQLGQKAPVVQGKLMALGTMASIHQELDLDTARRLAAEYGYEVRDVGFDEKKVFGEAPVSDSDANQKARPPVITVMGHVDHGKTSLLDAIRKTNVTEGEAGGITQHIGAYQVSVGDSKLTFIDTPGHEAFSTMRARGAQATDIVVLVVAASEGPMPQTVESINHARSAGVPIIVAVNKCDLPDARPDLTRQRLLEYELVPEEFGGDVLCVDVSAKKGTGIEKLLEVIALQAEMLELRADPHRPGTGVVLEARLDWGRGPVASILVQSGSVKKGDFLVAGTAYGRVRALHDENGNVVKEAGPSRPVEVLGLSEPPEAGQLFNVVENERAAREVVAHRDARARKEADQVIRPKFSLDELFAQAEGSGPKQLTIVLKADVQGSVEALKDSLLKLSTDTVVVNVIHTGVGGISESDVMLAAASGAIIIGFSVRPDAQARRAAESHGVDIRLYRVIYEALDAVRLAMEGLLAPTIEEVGLGQAEVREVFVIPRVGTVAGCRVTHGLMRRNALCRLVRDGVVIYESKISSLRRFKEDTTEVKQGFECGIGIENFNDIKVGDIIEAYGTEERRTTLE